MTPDNTLAQLQNENQQLRAELARFQAVQTEWQQTADALQEAHELNRQVIASAPIGVIVFDRQLRYQVWNPYMENLTGVPAGIVLGKHPDELFPFLREQGVLAYLEQSLQGETIPATELEYIVPQTGEKHVDSVGSIPLRNTDGEIRGVLVMVQDATERKRAEAVLQEREARYRALARHFPNGAVFLMGRDLRFLLADGTALAEIGMKSEEVEGRTLYEILPMETAQRLEPYYRAALAGETRVAEFPSPARIYETHFVPVRNEEGEVLAALAMAQNVTARRQAEEALRKSEEYYRALFEASPIGLALTRRDSGRFLDVNPAFERIVGRTRDELRQMTFYDITPDKYTVFQQEATRQITANGRFSPFIKEYIRKDGSRVPVRVAGIVVEREGEQYTWANVEDISEQVQQWRLNEQTQSTAQIGGWEIDCETNALYWTAETYRIHETTPQDYTPTVDTAIAFYAPESVPLISEAVRQGMEEGRDWDLELELITARGNRIWARAIGKAERENGRTIRLFGSFQNITERKRLEEQLLQSQKIEGIGRLAGGIAHDFNNLLTAILGYTELALQEGSVDAPVFSYLQQIEQAANRAADLTRQLLAFARKQIIAPQIIRFSDLTQKLEGMLRRLIGEDVELVILSDADLWHVRIDPGQFEQILVNLAVNARDAMPQGGTLTIETANVTLDAAYAHSHRDVIPGDYVMLAVSDTGAGMDESIQRHIFEPFFTTKVVGKGTGLGLATCHGIVKQNGGHIWVYSEPGRGTTFRIYLPRVAEVARKLVEVVHPPAPRGSETILLVEDEPIVRSYAEEALRAQGYTVLAAASGNEALEMAEQHGGTIHLLLTDVVMPQMSGKALSDALRSLRPATRTLYVSGYTENTIVHHGVLEEGVAFLQKPYTPGSLARKVRQVLDAL